MSEFTAGVRTEVSQAAWDENPEGWRHITRSDLIRQLQRTQPESTWVSEPEFKEGRQQFPMSFTDEDGTVVELAPRIMVVATVRCAAEG